MNNQLRGPPWFSIFLRVKIFVAATRRRIAASARTRNGCPRRSDDPHYNRAAAPETAPHDRPRQRHSPARSRRAARVVARPGFRQRQSRLVRRDATHRAGRATGLAAADGGADRAASSAACCRTRCATRPTGLPRSSAPTARTSSSSKTPRSAATRCCVRCRWQPDDEVLVLTHGYGAVRNAVRYVTERAGARMTEAALPFPRPDADAIVASVAAALTHAHEARGDRPHHVGQRAGAAAATHRRGVP